ncbi:MAG TPA: sugar phosphate nucleotidyltransferase [Gemmatimonadaceae bacterium]|nr:sugar phosphate nucleotidyltransferase [Gemmatimonadaceae bacterium]
MSRWVVVLAGGVGSRFWPLSTPQRPKQLLPLVGERPLLAETLERLRPLAPAARTLVLTSAALVPATRAVAPQLPPDNVVAEPRPAGTAAALAWAAAEIARRDGDEAVMICVHADWAIGNAAEFIRVLARAAEAAERRQSLVTVGVVPSRPDPGFGYIQPAEEVERGVRRVARFVEKPDRQTAERFVADGYLWNSGIFVWRVGDFLREVREHTPEVAPALAAHGGDAAQFFAAVRPIPVDVGVLERSGRVLVLPGDFGWDDVGTWAALGRVRTLDDGGNAASGAVYAVDASRNVVHAEGNAVVLYGVSDLVVVTRDGLTLVTTVDRSADLKTLVDSLPPSVRDRH